MKPKVAFYWCAACGGCEECLVDLNEDLLAVAEKVEIVFWPVALDFKEKDVAAMPDGAIAVSFINGAIRSDEQKAMALLLRKKSALVVAFGACAQMGGIPGLANVVGQISEPPWQGALLQQNGHTLHLAHLFETVLPLDRVIPVDYYIPGCPPTPNIIRAAFGALLGDAPPPRGTVLAPDFALCEQCPRKDTRPENLLIEHLRRVQECVLEENTCILAQGVICLGPATRAGCEARCISGNMPCTGCFGPSSRVKDFGGKALSSVASVLAVRNEADMDAALEKVMDPVGTFYRYSLPASLLEHKCRG